MRASTRAGSIFSAQRMLFSAMMYICVICVYDASRSAPFISPIFMASGDARHTHTRAHTHDSHTLPHMPHNLTHLFWLEISFPFAFCDAIRLSVPRRIELKRTKKKRNFIYLWFGAASERANLFCFMYHFCVCRAAVFLLHSGPLFLSKKIKTDCEEDKRARTNRRLLWNTS